MKKLILFTLLVGGLASLALQAVAQSIDASKPQAPEFVVRGPQESGAALGSEALGSMVVPVAPMPPLPPGPLTVLGNRLRESGVSPGLTLINANFRNPSTGISRGKSANYGELMFSVGLDLEKIAGLSSTELNITQVVHRPSSNTDQYLFQTGSAFTPFPVLNKATDLANFTVSHRTLDDRLKLEFGRMNLTREFMVGNMCSGCILSAQATVLNQPGISKSVWGATARYALDPYRTIGLGVLEDNPDKWQKTSGWNWGHSSSIGTIAVLNYTQRRGFEDTPLPYKLETGLFHSTSSYSDALYNTDGSSQAENSAGTPLQHNGRSGGYVQGRKVYWRGGSPGVPENLAAYGGVVLSPGAGEKYPLEAYVGTEWSGFAPSNPLAMIGSTLRFIRLSEQRALFEQQTRKGYTTAMNMMTGGAVPVVDERVPRNMFLLDVHGRVGLMPGVFLEGSVQYLKNPNALIPATTERIRNGFMTSLMLVVDFGVVSGLSRMPGDKIF